MKTKLALAMVAIVAGVLEEFAVSDRSAPRWNDEKISSTVIDREMELLRAQFGDEQKFRAALHTNHLWIWQLRWEIADHLRERAWLDRQLHLEVSETECRNYFAQHSSQFTQPARYHVAHLFVAAPLGSPSDVTETKRQTVEDWAQRLQNGEQFVDLAAQFSEDEASKKRGGDLGWFSDKRMPPDFMNAVHFLGVGDTSPVVQTKLGFHILRLIETQLPGALSFEEAQPEVVAQIQNEKRRETVAKLIVDLASEAPVVQSD